MQSLLRSFAGSDAMSGCLCTGSHVKRKNFRTATECFWNINLPRIYCTGIRQSKRPGFPDDLTVGCQLPALICIGRLRSRNSERSVRRVVYYYY